MFIQLTVLTKLITGVDARVRMQGVDGVEELKALDGKKTRCRGSEVREVNLCLDASFNLPVLLQIGACKWIARFMKGMV